MDHIRRKQAALTSPFTQSPPAHQPEILYIGCVDARLDPIDDIGIEKGKALIFRNIAALVLKDTQGKDTLDRQAALARGEIPANVSVGAALEFFLHHIPRKEGAKKHIVISGHTDCGGIKACRGGISGGDDHYLPAYLNAMKDVREKVLTQAQAQGWDEARIHAEMEQEAVRQSVANLLTYPAVKKALAEGTLEVHGWILNTATQRILEMNPKTQEFEPMALTHAERYGSATGNHR